MRDLNIYFGGTFLSKRYTQDLAKPTYQISLKPSLGAIYFRYTIHRSFEMSVKVNNKPILVFINTKSGLKRNTHSDVNILLKRYTAL